MKPILIIGIVLGVILITIGAFMYFYKLDKSMNNNAKSIDFLRRNDSTFLVISKEFRRDDSIAHNYDSIKLSIIKQNNDLLKLLLKAKNK